MNENESYWALVEVVGSTTNPKTNNEEITFKVVEESENREFLEPIANNSPDLFLWPEERQHDDDLQFNHEVNSLASLFTKSVSEQIIEVANQKDLNQNFNPREKATWYETWEISPEKDGYVQATVVNSYRSKDEALEAVKDKWNMLVSPTSYNVQRPQNQTLKIPIDFSDDFKNTYLEMERQKDINQPFLVGRWCENGTPEIGVTYNFSDAFSYTGATERTVTHLNRDSRNALVESDIYVLLQRDENNPQRAFAIDYSENRQLLDSKRNKLIENFSALNQSLSEATLETNRNKAVDDYVRENIDYQKKLKL